MLHVNHHQPYCDDNCKQDTENHGGYAELRLITDMYAIVYDEEVEDDIPRNRQLNELCSILNTSIDLDYLLTKYEETRPEEGDVHIFLNPWNEEEFIYINLIKVPYDFQLDIVSLGVRVSDSKKEMASFLLSNIKAYDFAQVEEKQGWLTEERNIENYPRHPLGFEDKRLPYLQHIRVWKDGRRIVIK